MKLSDYVAEFLERQGIGHGFLISGGCIVHVVDSLSKRKKIKYIPVQHEQAAAMAADGYARITGNLGLALTTSGPGATNLLTGVCCSYYDSVPTLMITGQVPTSQLKKDSKSRQIGFQETDVISIFQSVTKYATIVTDPKRIRHELEKAVYVARSDRPGPVLVDICDDVQRADINHCELEPFQPPEKERNLKELERWLHQCLSLIREAERPVMILGWGVKLAGAIEQAKYCARKLGIPVAPTWGGMDYIPYSDPLVIGSFGVSSERAGNFAVQNADLVIAIGTRLDTHETGPRVTTFARGARKVVVDVDPAELEKFDKQGVRIDVPICADIRDFFDVINPRLEEVRTKDISDWTSRIESWKKTYPICLPQYFRQKDRVNAYVFMDSLSRESSEGEIVITDAGGNLTWTMQGFRVKANQRLISAFNHSPMGYSLPASIGAAFASGKRVVCIIGDGGLQINVQELATVAHHNLPIKIFLMNNHGHGIIRQTLDTWLNSRYNAIDSTSGLPDPNFLKIAAAYGLETETIGDHGELEYKIRKVLNKDGPVLCNVELLPDQKIQPKLVFGKPIEDSEPLLDREEFFRNMIVPPLDH